MSITCNGVCHRYRASRPVNTGRYLAGQKRCNSCAIYIHWDGLFCPCCNYRLRLKPRNSKYKTKFLKGKSSKKEIIVNGV